MRSLSECRLMQDFFFYLCLLTFLSFFGSDTLMFSSHIIELSNIFRLTARFRIKGEIYKRPVFQWYRWLSYLWNCYFSSLLCLLCNKVYKSHLYYIFFFFLLNPACLLCTSGERHRVCLCEKCVKWITINHEICRSGHPYMSYWRILKELICCSWILGLFAKGKQGWRLEIIIES